MIQFGCRTAMLAAERSFDLLGAANPTKLLRPLVLLSVVPILLASSAGFLLLFTLLSAVGV